MKLEEMMTINENGEGEINGKTIRELEVEAMQDFTHQNNSKEAGSIKSTPECNKKVWREYVCKIKSSFVLLLYNNLEIFIGIIISLLFTGVYFVFRTNDQNANISLLSGLFSGLGAIIAILLSISFSKRTNKETWDSTVLPYIIIDNDKNLSTDYIAFEYVSISNNKEETFNGWRSFDFDTIKSNQRILVRNGIAYLHIKNIGLGPAKRICIKINNFSFLYLKKDYLLPNETMHILLNFNNPDKSQDASIYIEYETIRDVRHKQHFLANITWHLDRTNFTLLG